MSKVKSSCKHFQILYRYKFAISEIKLLKNLTCLLWTFGLINPALANRNPLNEIEGPGPSSGIFFLFYVLPVLLWLLGRFISNREKARKKTDLQKEKKKSDQFDNYIKKWSKENQKKQEAHLNNFLNCKLCGHNIPKPAKYQQWIICPHCKNRFQNPEWTSPQPLTYRINDSNEKNSVKNGLNEKFPELTDSELQEANLVLNGTKSTECPCCKQKDLITNFQSSPAGNTYRKCYKCGTNFQFSKSMIELQQVIYRRCFNCQRVLRIGEACSCQI